MYFTTESYRLFSPVLRNFIRPSLGSCVVSFPLEAASEALLHQGRREQAGESPAMHGQRRGFDPRPELLLQNVAGTG